MTIEHVLIVEDRPDDLRFATEIVREAFGAIELRTARSLAKARELLAIAAADLVVLDLNLPDGTGPTLIPAIRARKAETIVIVMTVFDDDDHLFEALQRGADGYLLKDESRAAAVELLRDVLEGRPPLSARMARRVLRFVQASPVHKPVVGTELTPREREVLVLLARGHTAASAADKLAISVHTVKTHVKSLYRKLEVSSRARLVRAAIDEGLA